jgi:uncharacterized protein
MPKPKGKSAPKSAPPAKSRRVPQAPANTRRVPQAPANKRRVPQAPANKSARAPKREPAPKPAPKRAKRALPVLTVEPDNQAPVACLTCALCCTYIAVAIDGPINVKAASEILWHLYHRDVSVYRDGDDEWMVQFEARCRHLGDDNGCRIYEQRPHICRTYSEQSCEVNSPDEGITFYAPDAFLAYLEKHHKRIHKELMRGFVPAPEHLGPALGPRHVGPDFEARFRSLRARRAQLVGEGP